MLIRPSRIWAFTASLVTGLSAAEFSIQIVDGLGRPIAGVQVEVSCVSPEHKITTFVLQSDQAGTVHGTYEPALCTALSVDVAKQGYWSYNTGFRERYVLKRQFSVQELLRVLTLKGERQRQDLRELLAGDFSQEWKKFLDLAFYHEDQLRPMLRSLATDPAVTVPVRDLLSMIGVSEDLHLIMQLPPPPETLGFPARWRYAVATALVDPDNEDEWSFLRECAFDNFDDHWVDAGAIQALQLTASSRSRSILEEAKQKNAMQASRIARAIAYVDSNPAPLLDRDLMTLAERAANILKIGKWEGNSTPRFNEGGDKALVDFSFRTSMDHLIYTGTFHRMNGVWRFRGAHETYQAFSP